MVKRVVLKAEELNADEVRERGCGRNVESSVGGDGALNRRGRLPSSIC